MTFSPGENVGPYRIVEEIAHGGMATIYKAYHAALDRDVAIKVIHPALTTDPSFSARFNREARIAARLHHPNIVPIYDFNDQPPGPYLVMRYIEGSTLKDLLVGEPLTTAQVMQIARPVGAALAYAHDQGVLHRDVKPSNILIADDGAVYLTDFGLARMAQFDVATLTQDAIFGTPQYIAPEQVKGEAVDARTDLYSFGIVLYELFVGRAPFSGESPTAVLIGHLVGSVPAPSTFNKNISPALEAVLLKALAKNPDDRYPTSRALMEALERALAGSSVATVAPEVLAAPAREKADAASSPPVPPPLTPLPRPNTVPPARAMNRIPALAARNLLIGLGAALVILVLALAFGGGLSLSSGVARTATLTNVAVVSALSLPTTSPTFTASVISANAESNIASMAGSPSPSPTVLPALSPTQTSTPSQAATATVPSRTSTRVPTPTSTIARVFGTPTTSSVAVALRGQIAYSLAQGPDPDQSSVMLASADGSNAHLLVRNASYPALSPDGRRIAYYHWRDSGIHVMDVNSGTDRKVFEGEACCVSWSPDGARLAFVAGKVRLGAITIANADGSKREAVVAGVSPAWSPDGQHLAYVSCALESTDCGIFVVHLATKQASMITRDGGANPRWSPRGDQIVYQASVGGAVNVFVVHPDGTAKRQLTFGKQNDGQPAFSADGNFIYWRSDQNGTGWAIWAMRADGSSPRAIIANAPPAPDLYGWESLSASP